MRAVEDFHVGIIMRHVNYTNFDHETWKYLTLLAREWCFNYAFQKFIGFIDLDMFGLVVSGVSFYFCLWLSQSISLTTTCGRPVYLMTSLHASQGVWWWLGGNPLSVCRLTSCNVQGQRQVSRCWWVLLQSPLLSQFDECRAQTH